MQGLLVGEIVWRNRYFLSDLFVGLLLPKLSFEIVEQVIAGDREQPGFEGEAFIDRRAVDPQFQKDILRQLFCGLLVFYEAEDIVDQPIRIHLEEEDKR